MKKDFIYRFFIILILTNCITTMAMQLRPLTKQLSRKSYIPKTIVYTKSYIKPTLTDRFKQGLQRIKQWLWGPPSTRYEIFKEANMTIKKIKAKDLSFVKDFDYTLKNETQEAINIYLNKLITAPESIPLVNEYTFNQLAKHLAGVNIAETDALLEKIILWAKDNIVQIFHIIPSLEKKYVRERFFLLTLLLLLNENFIYLESLQDLNDALINNASIIARLPNGRIFFQLLKEANPQLYKKIIAHNPNIPLQLKTIALEKNTNLITRE